jgi:mannose-6-phosphate isomerase
MGDPVPCILERKLLAKPWGGTALRTALGIDLGDGDAIGESWEVYDRPDGSSRIRGGSTTLRDLMRSHARAVLGAGVSAGRDGRFPLLIKFIDAREPLSVQVHPGETHVAPVGDGGKAEAWIVLHAGPNARIIRGFRPGVALEHVAAAAGTPALEKIVHAFRPAVGSAISVPPGTVHAIGPDVVVFEVQQNSDVTFRLHDWGRDRELHVADALRVARIGHDAEAVLAPEPIDERSEWLVRGPHFRVRRMRPTGPCTLSTEGSFKLLTVVRGFATLGWRSRGQDAPLAIRRTDSVLVPACTELVFLSPIGDFELLWTDPGEGSAR